MSETLEIIKNIPVEVLFIVLVSSGINRYFALAAKAKFLTPLVLALFCAIVIKRSPDAEMFRAWFEYAGQSMVLHQVWKKFLKNYY